MVVSDDTIFDLLSGLDALDPITIYDYIKLVKQDHPEHSPNTIINRIKANNYIHLENTDKTVHLSPLGRKFIKKHKWKNTQDNLNRHFTFWRNILLLVSLIVSIIINFLLYLKKP